MPDQPTNRPRIDLGPDIEAAAGEPARFILDKDGPGECRVSVRTRDAPRALDLDLTDVVPSTVVFADRDRAKVFEVPVEAPPGWDGPGTFTLLIEDGSELDCVVGRRSARATVRRPARQRGGGPDGHPREP